MSSYRLLLVDDEPGIRAALRRVLQTEPFEILEAGDGEEALALCAEHKPDLILSDQRMPGITGLELLSLAKEQSADSIRILMTGHAESQLALSDDETVFSFLRKPWDQGELLLLIRNATRYLDATRDNARLISLVRSQRRIIADLEARVSARSL